MTDVPIASHSFCVVEGCSRPSEVIRWVSITGDRTPIEVCDDHAEGELTENEIDLSKMKG